MNRWAAVCASLAFAASCASAPAQPRAVDPVGTFDFTTSMEGTAIEGTVTIQRAQNGYSGSLTTNVTEPIPVSSVVVDGQKVTVVADAPDGPVTMVFTFTGNDFTGNWTYGTMSGTASGRRRAG
jgi:hypothetical protein